MKSITAVTLITLLASTVSSQNSNGCDENYSGTFEIAPYNVTAQIPPSVETVCTTNPIVSLKDGVLTDQDNRTGEVVANHQFQFDNPVQGPTTSGFSVCSNGSLALHGSAIFYGCTSGDFSNLYDISIGAQCHLIYIVAFPCSGSGATPVASTPVVASTTSSSSSSSTPPPPPPTTSSTTSTSSTSSTPVAPPPTTSTTSTSSTPVAPPPTTSSTPVAPPPITSATVSSAPFPVGNSTTLAPSATKPATTTSTPTTPVTSTPPSTFKGAASIVAVGGKVVAIVAGIAAFALF